VLAGFRERLERRFGDRLRGLLLFGSRARGDHRVDSDADVAVFIDPVADPIAAQMDIAADAYLLFLDQGLLIQPWVFRGSPDKPDLSRAVQLLKIVRSEGVPL
jgi:predicted nucleotidyltransferase